MSNALAIASVSQVLKDLLNNGLIDHDVTGSLGGNVTVSCLPPDLITISQAEPAQLNLFMYMVTPNQGWRNDRLPSRDSTGERTANPPLALDLHYLLTAFCSNEMHTEILLGYGMQLLHESPVLMRDAIKTSLALPSPLNTTGLPVNLQSLATSGLAEQVEQIKLTPAVMNIEELSKLWTAFQVKYRPSAAFLATVVLIESRKSVKTALPVKARNIYVKPFKQPVIETIKSQASPVAAIVENQKILHGYRLVIEGYDLRAENLEIILDGIPMVPGPAATDVSDTQVIYPLPEDLPAGIHGVQVASRFNMGTPPVLHRGVESNVEAFVLSPVINTVNVSNLQGSGLSPRSANIGLNIKPAIGEKQRLLLLMNETGNAPGTAPHAYSFQTMVPLSPPVPAEDIVIPVTGISAGTYLLRIQIDGAESPLGSDANGKYNSPIVTIL